MARAVVITFKDSKDLFVKSYGSQNFRIYQNNQEGFFKIHILLSLSPKVSIWFSSLEWDLKICICNKFQEWCWWCWSGHNALRTTILIRRRKMLKLTRKTITQFNVRYRRVWQITQNQIMKERIRLNKSEILKASEANLEEAPAGKRSDNLSFKRIKIAIKIHEIWLHPL